MLQIRVLGTVFFLELVRTRTRREKGAWRVVSAVLLVPGLCERCEHPLTGTHQIRTELNFISNNEAEILVLFVFV